MKKTYLWKQELSERRFEDEIFANKFNFNLLFESFLLCSFHVTVFCLFLSCYISNVFSLKLNKWSFKWRRKFKMCSCCLLGKSLQRFLVPFCFVFVLETRTVWSTSTYMFQCTVFGSALSWEKSLSSAIWGTLSNDPFSCILEFCFCIWQTQALELSFDIDFSDVLYFISSQTSKFLMFLWAVLLHNNAVLQQLLILDRIPSISIFSICNLPFKADQ